MDIKEIIIAIIIVGIIALVIGIILSIAEKVFHVAVDKNEAAIRDALPGSNCGSCGFAGCDDLAKAIAKGDASVGACPVGGEAVASKIADIMGTDSVKMEKNIAFVKCNSDCDKKNKYNYYGFQSCEAVANMPGSSPYACSFGCIGLGSCAKACDRNAIKIIDDKAVVDEDLCIACGKCVRTCPHHLIELVPYSSIQRVQCSSTTKGKAVTSACSSGCIACKMCEKACEFGAISVDNNVAKIDYSKCTHCGACAEKCPRKIIKLFN